MTEPAPTPIDAPDGVPTPNPLIESAVKHGGPEICPFLPTFQEQLLDQIICGTLPHRSASQERTTAYPDEVEAEYAGSQDQRGDPGWFRRGMMVPGFQGVRSLDTLFNVTKI